MHIQRAVIALVSVIPGCSPDLTVRQPDPGGVVCPDGLADCASLCVDTATDRSNCGACGNGCAAAESCCAGACADTRDSPEHCGACGVSCSAAQTCCGGTCVDTASAADHCGGCGAACPGSAVCQGGSCACPAGLADCGVACANLLTSGAHCGVCGHDCQGGECVGGACQPVALISGLGGGNGSARFNSSAVFWLHGSAIAMLPFGAQGPVTLAVLEGYEHDIGVDAANVYVTSYWNSTLLKVPIDGSEPALLTGGQSNATEIVADQDSIAWARVPDSGALGSVRIRKKDGSGDVSASGQDTPARLTLDPNNLYWVAGGNLMKLAKTGGVAVPMTAAAPSDITSDGTNVYWVVAGDGTLRRIPVTGGTPVILASGLGAPSSVAVDETHVYWTNPGGGQVMRIPKSGGSPVTLASGQESPQDIAVDETSIYWANYAGGRFMRLAK